jgi:hypothetical protein
VLNQISLRMLREGAPLAELAAAAGILQDEALHTQLSFEVAEALGGYVPEIPSHLSFDAKGLSRNDSFRLATWLVVGCCVAETVSRALIQARLKATREPALRALIARTLKDENVHVAFGWAAAERAIKGYEIGDRAVLTSMVFDNVETIQRGACTILIEGKDGAAERRLRQRVADAGLGSCTPEEEDAVCTQCVRSFIVPRLKKMGLFENMPI